MAQDIHIAASPAVTTERLSGYLWLSFVICFLSNALAGTISTLMSVYLPVVVKDVLGTADEQKVNEVSAYINSLYIIGWAAGGFTWGMISDRIGRARSLKLSLVFYGVFTILTGFTSTWELIVIFRMLTGFGVGGVMVVSVILLSETFPERLRAIFVGILSIGFPVGIFSSGLVNYLVADWRLGFLVGSVPVILALLSVWLLRESEKWKSNQVVPSSMKASILSGETKRNLVKGSLIFGSMLIGLWAIFSWVPTWVQSLLPGVDAQQERGLSMMILGAGGLSGGFFSGWIANSLGVRRSMIIVFAGCFVLSFLLFKMNSVFSGVIYVEIGILSFLFGISQGLLSLYIPELFATSVRATATGICFNVGRLFTAAAVFFVGALVVSLGGYGNAIFTFSFVFLAGLVALFFTRDRSMLKPEKQ